MSVHKKGIIFDLITIAIMNAIVIYLAVKFTVLERFYLFLSESEFIQLDGVFPLSVMLLISLNYFILRRWRESVKYSRVVEQKVGKDSLTKLLNRPTIELSLATEWDRFLRYHEDFCVVLFDIDDFSVINENLGHVEGDRILIEVSNILKNNTRKTDLVARWGEEEFLVLCPVCKGEQGAILAEKLRSSIYSNLKDGIELSASFAVAQSDKTTSLNDLIKRMDLALLKAKHRGKNCVVIG